MRDAAQTSRSIRRANGFTIPEVIVAGTIMIVLCVGTLTVFSYAVKINRGNNLRMQALAVLQREVEEFRSLRFTPTNSDSRLNGGSYPNYKTGVAGPLSGDQRRFDISVFIDNDPYDSAAPEPDTGNEPTTKFKQIRIVAVPQVTEREAWLQNLGTEVTIQRVRSN